MRGLTKSFRIRDREIEALTGIDLEVAEGEFVCLVGPSGCGKSTILRILAGLEKLTSGSISVNVPDPESHRPLTSMVFQEQSVFPWMNVIDNVAFGLKARGVRRAERTRIATEHARLVGLADFADALPRQLSGGMKQRVAIARAFANDPEVLLMDEPFAALDEQTKLTLEGELLSLWERSRKTVVYVTHSIDEAILMGDRIVVMSARPGRILEILKVPFARPRTLEAVRADPDYGRLFNKVWHLLRPVG
jgi:NitT/TauT family transport system ATP-binding protein